MIHSAYTAYPIDQTSGRDLTDLYWKVEVAQQSLLGAGVDVIYDPGDAFQVRQGATPTATIARINAVALDTCDAVIAFLPAGFPTIGVPTEVERARAAGKPVAVCTDVTTWSLTTADHNLRVFGMDDQQVEQAATWLAQQTPAYEVDGDAEPLPWVHTGGYSALTGLSRAYPDDAGFDLIVSETVTVQPGQFKDIPCGVAVQLPPWAWGYLTGRSSTLRKKGLLVNPGVIDCGYRGPLFAGVFNLTSEPVEVKAGERVAQLIVLANSTRLLEPVRVDRLAEHPRGLNGFGSSGS